MSLFHSETLPLRITNWPMMNAGEKYEFLFKSNLLEIQYLIPVVNG
jgi:hypothetical protein